MATFTMPDPYEGWSEEKLKRHCRRLVRAMSRYECLIPMLVEQIPGGEMAVPAAYRDEVSRIVHMLDD